MIAIGLAVKKVNTTLLKRDKFSAGKYKIPFSIEFLLSRNLVSNFQCMQP